MADNMLMPGQDNGGVNPLLANAVIYGAPNLQPVGPSAHPFAAYDAPLNEAPVSGDGLVAKPTNFTTDSYEGMAERRDALNMKQLMGGHLTPEELAEMQSLHAHVTFLEKLHKAQQDALQSNVPNDVSAIMQGMRGASGGQ